MNPNYSTQGKSGKPALMRYKEIGDMLKVAETSLDLLIVKVEFDAAEKEYSEIQWRCYSVYLNGLYGAKLRLAALRNLQNQRAYS